MFFTPSTKNVKHIYRAELREEERKKEKKNIISWRKTNKQMTRGEEEKTVEVVRTRRTSSACVWH